MADECVNNIRTVRAFAMEDGEMELYSNELNKARLLNEKLGLGIGLFQVLKTPYLYSVSVNYSCNNFLIITKLF